MPSEEEGGGENRGGGVGGGREVEVRVRMGRVREVAEWVEAVGEVRWGVEGGSRGGGVA